jgi:hypothetical protein
MQQWVKVELCKDGKLQGTETNSEAEECRLLIYKNQVHISQETHNVSTTEVQPVNAM